MQNKSRDRERVRKFSFEHAPLKEFKAKMNFKIHLQRLFERIFRTASEAGGYERKDQ